jgi:hypothetical protein
LLFWPKSLSHPRNIATDDTSVAQSEAVSSVRCVDAVSLDSMESILIFAASSMLLPPPISSPKDLCLRLFGDAMVCFKRFGGLSCVGSERSSESALTTPASAWGMLLRLRWRRPSLNLVDVCIVCWFSSLRSLARLLLAVKNNEISVSGFTFWRILNVLRLATLACQLRMYFVCIARV